MDNIENILDELNEYEKHKVTEIPQNLEDFLNHIAKTGDTVFPWCKVKGVVRHKIELVMTTFKELCPTENVPPCPNVEPFNFETMKEKILEQFDSFTCAPFTIQRICELLCAPRKHYKRTDKFMRGIEKNLLVVSTVEPQQRKRSNSVSSTVPLVNGVEEEVSQHETSTFIASKDTERPLSAASDVASVSDADSGISDTEDEDKSKEETAAAAAAAVAVDVQESELTSEESPTVAISDCHANDETTDNQETTSQTMVTEVVNEKKTDNSETLVKVRLESCPENEEIKSKGCEKKRPLEQDEDDVDEDSEISREAKQLRIFSPEKPVTSTESSEGQEEEMSNKTEIVSESCSLVKEEENDDKETENHMEETNHD